MPLDPGDFSTGVTRTSSSSSQVNQFSETPRRRRDSDGVGLSGSTGSPQYIQWTLNSARNLAQKSIIVWVNIKALKINRAIFGMLSSGAGDEGFSIGASGVSAKLYFKAKWSTAVGSWRTVDNIPTGLFQVIVTYDNSSVNNDPNIYINGVLQSIVQEQNPVGTYVAGTNTTIAIGKNNENSLAIDGKIMSVALFSRILSDNEITSSYEYGARGIYVWAEHSANSLVFCPNMNMVTGIGREAFIGASITSSNKFLNFVDGSQGTVTGTMTGERAT